MEGIMEAIEITTERFKAKTVGLRQEIQELTQVLGGQTRNLDRNSEGSQVSMNEIKRGRKECSEEEMDDDRSELQPNWMKRVELPTFEGIDPLGWVSRVEKFFEIQNVTIREGLRLAYICMEGNDSFWFQLWKAKVKNAFWEEQQEALVRRFRGRDRGTVFKRLAAIK